MVWVGRGEDPYYSAHPGFKISTSLISYLETAKSLPSAQSMLIGNYCTSGNVNKNIKKVTKARGVKWAARALRWVSQAPAVGE